VAAFGGVEKVKCLVLALGALALGAASGAGDPPPVHRPLVLWVWERPEDLRFLDPGRHAAAVLAGTLVLTGDGLEPVRRRQPLALPSGLATTAVVRLETTRDARLPASGAPLDELVERILSWSAPYSPAAVQIDFDARRSERDFYRALLAQLRRRLPAATGLEITALASWCLGDPWIADLPIDDAIPMLFRMGVDEAAVKHHLASGRDFSLPRCRASLGLSLDEPLEDLPAGRRIHLFSPTPWSPSRLAAFEAGWHPRGSR
jgi:Protein of unknown function (DUF3142)